MGENLEDKLRIRLEQLTEQASKIADEATKQEILAEIEKLRREKLDEIRRAEPTYLSGRHPQLESLYDLMEIKTVSASYSIEGKDDSYERVVETNHIADHPKNSCTIFYRAKKEARCFYDAHFATNIKNLLNELIKNARREAKGIGAAAFLIERDKINISACHNVWGKGNIFGINTRLASVSYSAEAVVEFYRAR